MTDRTTGRIFNIQRYSIHDGDGIRTLVFLKGCPLKCLWCSNPESQKAVPELGFIDARCVGADTCGAQCVSACPVNAIQLNGQNRPVIDRDSCDTCEKCVEVCVKDALKVVGREMSVAEVMDDVEKDRAFYRRSGGGLTVGGGDPLSQYRFTAELLEAAGDSYIHTAIETCGHAPWKHFETVLRHVDLLQVDLKHMDPQKHKELTGQTNELIIDNLKKVPSVKDPQDVIIRIPVIPGCNDSVDNIKKFSKFVAETGFKQVELMPYHKLGVSKYLQYGMVYKLNDPKPPQKTDIQELKNIVEGFGLQEMTGDI